ncbi:MAG: protein YgfX [Gammaproteobacteria bacterium]
MPRKYSLSQQWTIKTSILEQRLIVTTHVLAVVSLTISHLLPPFNLLLYAAIGISVWKYRYTLTGAHPKCSIRYNDDYGWSISTGTEYRPIEIFESTVMTPYVIVLKYRIVDKIQYLNIFYDALDKVSYSRLIAQLKISGLNRENPN